MKPAIIYARVSSKDQEREGYSIPAQLKMLREYALKNDFTIVREFVDVETAKMAGRKNFGEMVRFPEIKESQDTYYRCTGHRGKCSLPVLSRGRARRKTGANSEDIHIPDDVLAQLEGSLLHDQSRTQALVKSESRKPQK